MLGLVTPCSLASLSNLSAQSLQHLSLLDHQMGTWSHCLLHTFLRTVRTRLTRPPTIHPPAAAPLISPTEVERLAGLRSLALDFSDLTSELCGLLASKQRVPLHRLSLLLNAATLEGTATDDDWKALVTHRAATHGSVFSPHRPETNTASIHCNPVLTLLLGFKSLLIKTMKLVNFIY